MRLLGCNIAHFKNKRHQLLDDNRLLQLIESQFMFLLNFILHHFSNFIQMKHAIYLLFLYLHNETFSFQIILLYCLIYILNFWVMILIYLIFSMFCSAIYVRPSVAWRAPQQVPVSSYLPTHLQRSHLLIVLQWESHLQLCTTRIWQYYLIFIWSPENPGSFSIRCCFMKI